MKKNTALFFAAILLITVFSGCASKVTDISIKEPDILQVRNICNLATLDCYYHNVAKSVKTTPSGITHLGEKYRTFWIEYTGVARLGIDMSKVEMKIHGTDIELNMPKATVLSITIDKQTLGEDSYIASPDGLNKNKITAKHGRNCKRKFFPSIEYTKPCKDIDRKLHPPIGGSCRDRIQYKMDF